MLIDCFDQEYKKRGKELKVPYHASTAAARDGNMPYIKATCLIQLPLAFIPNTGNSSFVVAIYIQLTQLSVIL